MSSYSCYSFPTWHDASSSNVNYLLDVLGMESSLLRVRVADLVQQSVTQIIDCSGESNTVNINMHKDKRYAIMGDAGVYFVPAIVVSPRDKKSQRLRGYTFPVLVGMDKPLPLLAMDFEDNASELSPVAQMQLEQLAKFMLNHPAAIVEFLIDVAGSDDTLAYNLSLERGRAIQNYMTVNGIEGSRVLISAYGNVNVKRRGNSSISVRFRE